MRSSLALLILLADAGSPPRGLDPQNCGALQVVPALAGDLSAVAFSPDGRICAVGGTGHVVRVYEVPSWREACEIKLGERVAALAFLPDSRRLVAGGETWIRVLDVEQGKEVTRFSQSLVPTRSIALSPDGKTLLSAHGGGVTAFWDAERGLPMIVRREPGSDSVGFARSPHRAAVGGPNGARIWVRKDSEWRPDLEVEGEMTSALAFPRDERFLLLGGGSGALTVWSFEKAQAERVLTGHPGSVRAVAVTPDDRFALTGADDGTIRVWDWRRGGELAQLKHAGVRAIALHPSGRMFATVGTDRQLRIWGYVRGGGDRPKIKGFGGISFVKRGGTVIISALVPGGPAEQSGLKVGDAVRVIGMTAIKEPAEALETIGSYADGDEAVFEIERDGQEKQVRVRLGRRPGARSP